MNVLILAGGLGTRLAPLTDQVPKPLLPLGGIPIIEHIYDKVSTVDSVTGLYVLTSQLSFPQILKWVHSRPRAMPIHVVNNAEASEFERSGTLPGVSWVIRHVGLFGEALLTITGDSYMEFSLAEFVASSENAPYTSCLCLHPTNDPKLLCTYDSVELYPDGRIARFMDPPARGRGERLIRTGIMRTAANHLRFIDDYLRCGYPVSNGKMFARYLHERTTLHGRRVEGVWIDAGTPDELLAADNLVRRRMGLPVRASYIAGS